MDYEFLDDLIHRLPLGYAYYRTVADTENTAADYIFLDTNDAFDQLFGLDKEFLLEKRLSESRLKKIMGNIDWVRYSHSGPDNGCAKEISQTVEIHGQWYKAMSFSPGKDQFITVFQNITSEVQSLQALHSQKQKLEIMSDELKTIFDGTQDALFLVEYQQGRFRYIRNNATHQQITGLGMQDIAGKSPEQVLGKELGRTICGHYRKCAAEGKAITYEQELVFPTGNKIWMTGLIPLFENGKVTRLIGSGRDITELKNLQRDKEDLLRRMQSMFQEHTAARLIIDPGSGRILDANPAACTFYGYTRKEILRLHMQDIRSLSREETEKYLADAVSQKQRHFICPHRLKNGEVRMVDDYSSPISYNGNPVLYSVLFDVSNQEKYREELYVEKELLSKTLNSIGDGVVTTDNGGVITAMNKAAQEITGWSGRDAKNRPFTDVFRLKSEITGNMIPDDPIRKVLREGKIVGLANHTLLINKQGHPVPIADSAAPITDEEGKTFGVVMVFRDVSRDKARRKQILYLSYHDTLTGLYNRRFLEEELQRMENEKQFPFALIMGDVNGLKITNDVFGHKIGDRLLQRVAQTLTENCPPEDIISRWGGDEFLILLPHTSIETAEQTIKKIKNDLAAQNQKALTLSAAFGCAVAHEGDEISQVLQKAEEWMYHQKLLEGKSYRNSIINTLLCTLYEKSLETEEHDERIRGYCQAIGKELKLFPEDLNELSLLALLHDIGKVGIRQEILQKPGPLTPEEWAAMKSHPEIGCRIAQNIPELSAVSEYILSHHERWDGKGYPNGLAGTNIPLLCRILAVADAYDAMTNDRAYRKAMDKDKAIAELKRNAGTQFDPRIAETFIRLVSA